MCNSCRANQQEASKQPDMYFNHEFRYFIMYIKIFNENLSRIYVIEI